jgi:uncharacterized SAM-binding protein YcdF (DUF218 family)
MSRGVRGVVRRRWLRGGLLATGAIVVAWLVACYLIVVDPTVNRATRADAVVVLGPPTKDGRLGTGLTLINQGYAGNLVISLNSPKQREARQVCEAPPAGVSVTCFTPNPATTQGEAQNIRRLAAAQHWNTIIVVTSTYHVSRARMIIRRCFDGTLEVVAARPHISLLDWAYQFAYQTGGYLKAAISRGC